MPFSNSSFTCLNVNIRSISKNLDKLKECMRIANYGFTVIDISETHFKGTPLGCYNLPGYKMEFVNRIDREKGCMFIHYR